MEKACMLSSKVHVQRQAPSYLARTVLTLAGVAMIGFSGMREFPALDVNQWFDHDLSVFDSPAAKTYYSLRQQECRAHKELTTLEKSSFPHDTRQDYLSLAQQYAQSKYLADSLEETDPATIAALSEIQDKEVGAAIDGFLLAAGFGTILLTWVISSLKRSTPAPINQDQSLRQYAPRGW
jgi:hypothetical protein